MTDTLYLTADGRQETCLFAILSLISAWGSCMACMWAVSRFNAPSRRSTSAYKEYTSSLVIKHGL